MRIHQNLINREDLPQPLKEQAMFELGVDYLKSGLLDRSEEIFKRLSEGVRREDEERLLGHAERGGLARARTDVPGLIHP